MGDNVSFIFEPVSMGRILLTADYPNLTELKLFNFEQRIALNHFTSKKNNNRMILNRTDNRMFHYFLFR